MIKLPAVEGRFLKICSSHMMSYCVSITEQTADHLVTKKTELTGKWLTFYPP
jgi:hypothetical protein